MRIAISHAPWADGRPASLARLIDQLDTCMPIHTLESVRREHPSVFGTRLWTFVEGFDGEPVICLEDDVQVPPGFVEACEAAFDAGGGESLSLHLQAPGLSELTARGARWARCYWLSTVACILTPEDAASLLDFAAAIPWRTRSAIAHDNVAIHWAWSRQRPFLATIPCLATHDESVPSTLGYDGHPHRGPGVVLAPGSVAPIDWPSPDGAEYVANPWASPEWCAQLRASLRSPRGVCAMCLVRPAEIGSDQTAALCRICIAGLVTAGLGVNSVVRR